MAEEVRTHNAANTTSCGSTADREITSLAEVRNLLTQTSASSDVFAQPPPRRRGKTMRQTPNPGASPASHASQTSRTSVIECEWPEHMQPFVDTYVQACRHIRDLDAQIKEHRANEKSAREAMEDYMKRETSEGERRHWPLPDDENKYAFLSCDTKAEGLNAETLTRMLEGSMTERAPEMLLACPRDGRDRSQVLEDIVRTMLDKYRNRTPQRRFKTSSSKAARNPRQTNPTNGDDPDEE